MLFVIKRSSYLEKYFDKQPEHTVKFAVSPLVPECNVFTNCHGPQCCSRVSTRVFGKSNRNLEYVIIFFNISVTSKYVINLIIFPYVQDPKIDFLAAYNSRTGNGLVKNSVLPSAAINRISHRIPHRIRSTLLKMFTQQQPCDNILLETFQEVPPSITLEVESFN